MAKWGDLLGIIILDHESDGTLDEVRNRNACVLVKHSELDSDLDSG